MKTTNETCADSNYSSFIKDSYQKNSLGYFPLLKFKENLYNTCQSKFSEYINNKKGDLKLIINNKINQQISIYDYIHNSFNELGNNNKLTPIPSINKRKIQNEGDKKELKNFQRNVVLMRRLEYANKMKEKNMKKKYKNKINQIILLQKMIRGYLVRKVINQVNIINETLNNFLFIISFCIKKKYFFILINNISQMNKENQEEQNKNLNNENNEKNENNNIKNNIINNDCFNNDNDNEFRLTQNQNFFDEENNENKINDNQIETEKEKIEKIDILNRDFNKNNINNNINNNDINKAEEINLKEKQKNDLMNIDNKQERINTDIINHNNSDKNRSKGKISMPIIENKLDEVQNDNNESNTANNPNMLKYNSPNNLDSIIENDDYIDFSGKNSKNFYKGNFIKDNNLKNRNNLNFILPDIPHNLRKTKTETIQRQFRKYLSKKGYYGNFDKRKIAIIYLIKNMILCNIRIYTFNSIKLIYKEIKNINSTQEENFFNIPSDRIENIKKVYNSAYNHINYN
jgi:hypothetical protein